MSLINTFLGVLSSHHQRVYLLWDLVCDLSHMIFGFLVCDIKIAFIRLFLKKRHSEYTEKYIICKLAIENG